tara:strand:- start:1 stop:525 length:525 start_codon:yes stop_codon:yes gene_type:complete
MDSSQTEMNSEKTSYNKLEDKWVLWAHLPHDTNWNLDSYKNIYTFTCVEEVIAIIDLLPHKLVSNCMLFIMREGINPVWEDPKNRGGGCFSYKVNNKNVYECWKKLSYVLTGESLISNYKIQKTINGITISPKKNFCIIKIWLSSCDYQDPTVVFKINDLSSEGCLFKKHSPEF